MTAVPLSVILLVAMALQAPDPSLRSAAEGYRHARVRQYDEAVADFRLAVKLNPGRVELHKEIGYLFVKMGRNEDALGAFFDYLRVRPAECPNILQIGYLLQTVGRDAEALGYYQRAAWCGDKTVKLHATQAFNTLDGELRDLIEQWKATVAADPSRANSRETLAQLYERHGDYSKAMGQVDAAYRLAPGWHQHLLWLGRLAQRAGEKDQAIVWYLLASYAPVPSVAMVGRAQLLRTPPTAAHYQSAMEKRPDLIPAVPANPPK